MRSERRPIRSFVLTCAAGFALAAQASAGVYQSVEQALKLAFPDAERFEKQSVVLTTAQKQRVEELAKAPVDSLLATVQVARRGADVVGYAFVDVHVVRTVQQGLLVTVTPEGKVGSVRLLAFYEPPDYLPKDRFRAQYENRALDGDLQLGAGIQAVSGATLSSVATTRAVRRSLAFYQVLVVDAATPKAAPQGADAAPPAAPVSAGGGK